MTTEINKSENNNSSNLLKTGLVVVTLLIVGSFLLRWLAALAIPILLFINRDWTFRIGEKIMSLYQQNVIYGLVATIAAFLLLTPFSILLFFRTIYNIFVLGNTLVPQKAEILDLATKAKKEIEKLKIDDDKETPSEKINIKDDLLTAEEIRKKFKDDFNI